MTPALKAQLLAKYPRLLGHPPTLELGDGWYHLIDALCDALQRETDQGRAGQLVFLDLREKYGLLDPWPGGEPGSCTERQLGMIEMAETLSQTICDVCGAPGKLNETGWYRVRCQDHWETLRRLR